MKYSKISLSIDIDTLFVSYPGISHFMMCMYSKTHNFGIVVVPVYNELSRYSELYWTTLLKKQNIEYIFVDDGSIDGTDKILIELENSYENVKYLRNDVNRGKAKSIKVGFDYAIRDLNAFTFVGYLDFDNSFDPEEINSCLEEVLIKSDTKIDVYWYSRIFVYGDKIDRKLYRHYISRILMTFFGVLNKRIPYDSQLGFKVFTSKTLISRISKHHFQTKWFIDLEILLLSNFLEQHSSAMVEIPIMSWKDVKTSAYQIRKIPEVIRDILVISKLLKRVP
jgi:glycosyltransferase involved in cell wall biosynthesis